MDISAQTDHRPYPMMPGQWAGRMTWTKLLFAHWACSPEAMRKHIPAGVEIDTHDGLAYAGVIPFLMSNVGPRWLPADPYSVVFPELNVRTYVKAGGRRGVYFFSLDAADALAVFGARRFFLLPYFKARMSMTSKNSWVRYESERTHHGAPPARFLGRYRPVGDVFRSQPGSLEEWLTERYCLFSADGKGQIYRGEIHHVPWPLQRAEADIEANTMVKAAGLFDVVDLGERPHLLYAEQLDTIAWLLEPHT